ncbi:MAG TPA: SHOCT domain-containing protein [Rhodospirillales bacterium]|nr:SHOCT domain-containing protein [Rhodospirillales bacterium]
MHHGYGHGAISLIVSILVIGLVVLVIARIWRGGRHGTGKQALDILGQRYANGEIDETEYRDKRNVLKSRK